MIHKTFRKVNMKNICIECHTEFEAVRKAKCCSGACRKRYNYKLKKIKGINPYELQKSRGLAKKIRSVKSKGGKCKKCGYAKNLSALEFHHIDPSTKNFQIDLRVFSNLSDEALEEEIAKCILVCANCHREIHNPDKNDWNS